MKIRHLFHHPKLPEIKEDDEKVRELREIIDKMPGSIEAVFHLSQEPAQCTIVSMVVAQYLREKGYDAHSTPALYTRTHPIVARQMGRGTAIRSMLLAKAMSRLPLYERNPKRYSRDMGSNPDERSYLYKLLYLAEDSFVRIKLSDGEHGGEYYMAHPTYRQFLPLKKQKNVPPVIFDRVDAHKLRKKYHLALTSPEHVSNLRVAEQNVFAEEVPDADQELIAFRNFMRDKYEAFKAKMEE